MNEDEAVETIVETIAKHEEKKTQRIHAARIIPGVGIFGVAGEIGPNYLKRLKSASDAAAGMALEGLQRDIESHAGLAAATIFGTLAALSKVAGHPTAAQANAYLTAAGLGAWAKDKVVAIHLQREAERQIYNAAREIVDEIHENLTPEERKNIIRAALAIEKSESPLNKALGRAVLHAIAAKKSKNRR